MTSANIGAKRSAAALSAAFGSSGTRERLVQQSAIARDVPVISLYDNHGFFDRLVSYNDVTHMLAERRMHASDATVLQAMKERTGLRLRNGEALKVHAQGTTFAAK